MADVDGAAPFVELGLDSLTLTQAALQVKKTLQGQPHLPPADGELSQLRRAGRVPRRHAAARGRAPRAASPRPRPRPRRRRTQRLPRPMPPRMPVACSPLPHGRRPTARLVQQVIAQQMQLMQQQLALLSAAPTVPVSPALPAPAVDATHAAWPPPRPRRPAPRRAPALPRSRSRAPKYDVKKAFGAIARIHTQSKEPTERQKARLDAFMRRYVERTRKSKAFTAAATARTWPTRAWSTASARDQGDHLPDRDRALQGLAAVGHRRQRVRRRAQRLRHEPVRLAARLHQRGGAASSSTSATRSARSTRWPATWRSSCASSPASTARACATPAPRR